MGQMIPITLPADGNWPTIVGDSIMIIGPRQNELTEEQRYFNPIYLMTYPGKEHLKAQMIRAGACDCDPTIPNRRIGVFSVAPDKKVSFSQGNLQYLPAINLWKFADTQYEYLGNANKYLKPTFRNWVDLFGWSANNTTAPFGVSTSTNAADYAGDFVDWGTNTICGDAPDTWRTLSVDEWEYIYHGRKNADQLLAIATLEGVQGLVLLPDNWQQPEDIPFVSSVEQGLAWDATRLEGSYFDATNKDHTKDNIYTQAQWQKMEALGAVFLPCAGWRQEKTWTHAGIVEVNIKYLGSYWSCSTPQISNDYYLFRFTQQEIRKFPLNNSLSLLARGRSVRLVHDTIVPKVEPEPCLVVKVNDTLSINMMCVEGGTFMMGAMESDKQAHANEKPAHQVTLTYDYYIGQTEVTQALWQAVMGNNPSTMIGDNLPVNNVLWEEADAFVKRLSQMTGYTFHLPTEAEWEYAARGGKKSKGYLYAGSNKVDEVAWYHSNSGGVTHPVAQKMPNELGIYDMSGNVIEWCSDLLGPYSAEAQVNPIGPATGAYHVYCGGCWYLPANVCRCTHRRQTTAGYGEAAVGFRVALREKVEPAPEPEYVDLGLSVKWATFNVGATKPEEYGDYFAWGETETKDKYSWATYKWGTSSNLTKYNTTDGKTILDLDDDAAYVNWGGNWRMPSKEEVDELTQQCSWIWTTHNNVNGYKVTGPNGNSIFLPAAGYKGAGPTYPAGEDGLYWTSTLEKGHYSYLIVLHNDAPPTQAGSSGTRCFGFTIRPVYDDRPDPCLVVKVNDTLSINMMCVEGGTFMMGSDSPGAEADEQPVHEVTLSDYYIGQIEVTQHLWKAVMGSSNNPSATKGDELPVTNITWNEAQTFVERLSELTGLRFRLPTEAEWEYAARGGQKSKGYTYAGSNDIDQVGWYNGNSSNKTHAVGQKQPNELGIYDMTGNVWEYCYDWHTPYAAQAQTNPTGAVTGEKHVLRGGCYHYDPKNCTNTNRHSYYTPDKGGASTGLRIVLEP